MGGQRLRSAWPKISVFFTTPLRDAVKNYLAIFSVQGGGVPPPFPLSFFGHNDFLLRGGYPPIPLRKKPAEEQLFLAKKRPF